MKRKYARTDANHTEIVKFFRDAGCSVVSLAAVGKGCPDLLVARRGVNVLVEVKDGSKSPSERKLTPDEVKFYGGWRGKIEVIENKDQAHSLIESL